MAKLILLNRYAKELESDSSLNIFDFLAFKTSKNLRLFKRFAMVSSVEAKLFIQILAYLKKAFSDNGQCPDISDQSIVRVFDGKLLLDYRMFASDDQPLDSTVSQEVLYTFIEDLLVRIIKDEQELTKITQIIRKDEKESPDLSEIVYSMIRNPMHV